MTKFFRFIDLVKTQGLRLAVLELLSWLLRFFSTDRLLQRVKRRIARRVASKYSNVIFSGPFKGMVFSNTGWGSSEHLGMLAGTYEYPVVDHLSELARHSTTFIDIGAASGYYSVGLAQAFPHLQVFAFESSPRSRKIMEANVLDNRVDHQIEIFGKFEGDFPMEFILERCFFLFDIEGGEYSLINRDFLIKAKKCHFVVELHGRDESKIEMLQSLFAEEFYVNLITNSSEEIFRILDKLELTENETNLIASDGRERRGRWLTACPQDQGCFCRSQLKAKKEKIG